ncbi:MAG: P-loop NTPase fold protein, partial [Xenococcus sp. (in: cyanobacteria)]
MAESEDKSKNATTGDQPATKRSLNAIAGDQPATIDSLGFEPYVIAIADFLTDPNTKPPLTLSIEGEWGSGKSSFMKQLEQEIQKKSEERNNYKSFTTWFKVRQGKFITLQLIKYFKLRFKPKTQTVWFNAWRHDKAEALWAAFALSFLDQISTNRSLSDIIPNSFGYLKLFSSRLNQKGKIFHITQFIATSSLVASIIIAIPILYFQVSPDKISQWSEDIVCMLEGESSEANNTSQNKQTNNQQHNNDCSEKPKNPILTWLLLIGGFGGSFTGIAKLFTKLKDIVGDPKMDLTQYLESPDYDKQIAFIEKFHDDFSKIVDAYAGKDEKVYVFIDDLDRCELGKSADLLQALNLMISNDPNIIFILGMDRKKVAATITYQQKDILPYLDSISEKNGKSKEERNDTSMKELDYGFSFMEKFIQLSFEVPKPSEPTLDKFFEEIFVNNDNESKKENSNNQKSGVADFVYDFYLLAITKLLNDRYFRLFSFYFHTLIQQRQKSLIPFILKLVRHTVARLLEKMKKEQETERKPHESENRREIDSIIKQELSDFYPIIGKDLSPDIEYRLLKMGANFFDYNPRRLKQYINLVRLHTYILYYAVGVPKDEERSLY